MHRNVHYEAAFEDYLRSRALPYVAVDEARKAIFGAVSLKSFDFIVYSPAGRNLLIDVKGRKFPDTLPGRKNTPRKWENWVPRDDLQGLTHWQGIFGDEFRAMLVFAYWLQGPPGRAPFEEAHVFRERHYAFMAIGLEEYVAVARPRSQKWQTLSVASATFAQRARDIARFL